MKIQAIADGQKIKKPGIYRMSNDWYHDDCTVEPSVSSTMLYPLLNDCPAKVYYASYLPARYSKSKKKLKREDNDRFDLGEACHTAVLEGKFWTDRCTIVPSGNWSSPRAKFLKKQAQQQGGVALLKSQATKVFAMRDALLADKEARELVTSGQNELSYFWFDEARRIWLKVRPDVRRRCKDNHVHVVDYKTSQGSVSDRAVAYRMAEFGYHMSAEMYLDVMGKIEGTRPKTFTLLCQETVKPHLINVLPIGEIALDWGKIQLRAALDLFTECLKRKQWPQYVRHVTLEIPRNIEAGLEERKDRGEFGTGGRTIDDETVKRVFGWGNDPKALEAY